MGIDSFVSAIPMYNTRLNRIQTLYYIKLFVIMVFVICLRELTLWYFCDKRHVKCQ